MQWFYVFFLTYSNFLRSEGDIFHPAVRFLLSKHLSFCQADVFHTKLPEKFFF
ncbi:hypothetical protein MBAV_002934 [Candidatus Magnetobacterium bavaricum]|uniref:Uncharacterized protein n=1 Tax=Candidatus Magnetobacterium bavaricum TaxID=29290 RepID=A0A0F3GW42_9BACT|nr:hypothetical protein MBAV_002934 [Candidatus Magnetobacterium bavaricum]